MERIKQKLDEARKQREKIQQGYAASVDPVRDRHSYTPTKDSFAAPRGNHTRLLSVVAVISIPLLMLIWWSSINNEQHTEQLSDIEIYESRQAIGAMNTTVEVMSNKIAYMAAQMDALSESITQFETKLISTQMTMDAVVAAKAQPTKSDDGKQKTILSAVNELDTLPPPASGPSGIETNSAKPSQSLSAQVVTEPSATLAKLDKQRTGEPQPAIEAKKKGPWVINLVSTPSKVEADRLAQKASSKNIQTELQPITVKGTKYWRVQITGFTTADDARTHAEIAKKQLSLKDAWIMKR